MLKSHNFQLAIIVSVLLFACSPPGGKISPDSNTEECEKNLLDGLQTFSSSLGLSINFSSDDAEMIIQSGEISKTYGRDGFQYTAHFGIKTEEGSCKLVLYKLDKKGPGENTSNYNDYGSVELKACKCQ